MDARMQGVRGESQSGKKSRISKNKENLQKLPQCRLQMGQK